MEAKNKTDKRYSQSLIRNPDKREQKVNTQDIRKAESKDFMLLPQEVVVNRPQKSYDQYIISYPKDNHNQSKERINASSFREERDGSIESHNTAKRLIHDPTLQKIKQFMAMETQYRKRGSENDEILKSNTQSFFKMIPNVNLDLGSREYPTMYNNTEGNHSKWEESHQGGIIPLKRTNLEKEQPVQTIQLRKEQKKIVSQGNEIIEKELAIKGKNYKSVRQKQYYGQNKPKEEIEEEDDHSRDNGHLNQGVKIKEDYLQGSSNDNEKGANEEDDEYPQEHRSEKDIEQQQNYKENDDDEDNQYEVQVNPNAYSELEMHQNEANNNKDESNDNANEEVEENEEENFAEIKKFMNQNESNRKEIEMPEGQEEQYYNHQEEAKGEIEDNHQMIVQSKPSITKLPLPHQSTTDKGKGDHQENKDQIDQQEREGDNDDGKDQYQNDPEQEDMVKMQRTEESQFDSNNNTNTQLNNAKYNIIKEQKHYEDKKQYNPQQKERIKSSNNNNNYHYDNYKYQKSNLMQQSSIQYEQHPEMKERTIDRNDDDDDEYIYHSPLNYDYRSLSINNNPPSQFDPLSMKQKESGNYLPLGSRNQPKQQKYVPYTSESNNECITEQSINPSNLYSTLKTETTKSRYHHHKDYLPTEIVMTEPINNGKRNNDPSFVEKTAQILHNPNSRSNTIERESKLEQLRSKYQYEIPNDTMSSNDLYSYQYNHNTVLNKNILEISDYKQIDTKSAMSLQPPVSSSSSSLKKNPKGFVTISKEKKAEESDRDKFNLHYNYSNEYFYNEILQNKQKAYLPHKGNAMKRKDDDKQEEFIQDPLFRQQINTNNYNTIEVFSHRKIASSSSDSKELEHSDRQREVDKYFDYNYNASNSIKPNVTYHQMRTQSNEYYAKPKQEIEKRDKTCICNSSREDLATLYLKAFPTYSFKRYSPSQPPKVSLQYSKLCHQCAREIKERKIMDTLL